MTGKQPVYFLTGITGQMSSACAEYYLNKGAKVIGLKRRSSVFNTERIDHINDPNFSLEYGDICDPVNISTLVAKIKPDYYINFACMSHVAVSFLQPLYSIEVGGNAVMYALESIKTHSPNTRFLQLSTSEMFGQNYGKQNEDTVLAPVSPYGLGKMLGHNICRFYRQCNNIFAANAILFNTESKTRSPSFLTAKVAKIACQIKLGLAHELRLGALYPKRDWNHVLDQLEGIDTIIHHNIPDDFVVASGQTHSVEEFVELVFTKLDLNYKDYVISDPAYLRPLEVPHLEGDASKLRALGWVPKRNLNDIVDEMISHFMKQAQNEKLIHDNELNNLSK